MRIRAKRNSLLAVIPAFSLSFVQAFAALGLLACGGDKPPAQLPSTAARDRVATRIELVDMVISDPVRAAKVRSLYMAMDSLLLETKRTQAQQLVLLGAAQRPSTDAETRAALAAVSKAESNALERYMGLQLELRRHTTADEFARLDKIR